MKKYITAAYVMLLPFISALVYEASPPPTLWASHILPEKPVSIPSNLPEGFAQLRKEISEAEILHFQKAKEEDVNRFYNFGIGDWVQRHWKLSSSSPLTEYFNKKGLTDPEWMLRVILVSFHRDLNHEPLRLDEQIHDYRQNGEKIRKEEGERAAQALKDVVATVDPILQMKFSKKKLLELLGGDFTTEKWGSEDWFSMKKKGGPLFESTEILYEKKKSDRFDEVFLDLALDVSIPKEKILSIYGKYPQSQPQPASTLSTTAVSYQTDNQTLLTLEFYRSPEILSRVIVKNSKD